MIDTSGYRRFERVDEVEETARGLEAALHGERLRIDVVRDDVVRFKISRGGAFDETPTFAVCVDPTARAGRLHRGARRRRRARAHGRARRHARARPVPPRRPPARRQPGRRDGARRRRPPRRPTSPATTPGRCGGAAGPEDAIYGLGEKAGAHNRKGRDFTLWNTDVLDDAATAEFIAGRDDDDPRADPTSAEFDPYYVSIPFFHHHAQPSGAVGSSFIDNGHRAFYDFTRLRRVRHPLRGRPVHGVRLRRPGAPRRSSRPTRGSPGGWRCRRSGRSATTSAAGSRTRRTRSRRSARATASSASRATCSGSTSTTWTATASSPGTRRRSPTRRACSSGSARQGFRVITIIDPGVKAEPGYEIFDRGPRARRLLPHGGRRRLHRAGLAGRHGVPRLRHGGGARVVGRAQRRPRAVGPRRHLERHERAGHGRDPAGPDALRPRRGTRTSATTTSTRC